MLPKCSAIEDQSTHSHTATQIKVKGKHDEERKKQGKDDGDRKYAGQSSDNMEKHANERAHLVKVKAVTHGSRKLDEE